MSNKTMLEPGWLAVTRSYDAAEEVSRTTSIHPSIHPCNAHLIILTPSAVQEKKAAEAKAKADAQAKAKKAAADAKKKQEAEAAAAEAIPSLLLAPPSTPLDHPLLCRHE